MTHRARRLARLAAAWLVARAAGATFRRVELYSDASCARDGFFLPRYTREDVCMSSGDRELGSDGSLGFFDNEDGTNTIRVFDAARCGGNMVWQRQNKPGLCLPSWLRVLGGTANAFTRHAAVSTPEASVAADGLIVEAWWFFSADERGAACGGEPLVWTAYERGACYKVPRYDVPVLPLSRDEDLYVVRDCDADGAEVERYFGDAECAVEVDPRGYELFERGSHSYGALAPTVCAATPQLFRDGRNWGCARPAGPAGPFYWSGNGTNSSAIRLPTDFSSKKKKKSPALSEGALIGIAFAIMVGAILLGVIAYKLRLIPPITIRETIEVTREVRVTEEVPVDRPVIIEVPSKAPEPVFVPEPEFDPGAVSDSGTNTPPTPAFHTEEQEPTFVPPEPDELPFAVPIWD